MRVRLNVIITTALTLVTGLITILGLLIGEGNPFYPLTQALLINDLARFFVRLAVIVIAMSIFIGFFNLLFVHMNRLLSGRGHPLNRLNSLILILVFLGTIVLYVVNRDASMILLEDVQVAIESSLAGLLFFALVYGAFRVMRYNVSLDRLLFVLALLLVLMASLPLPFPAFIRDMSDWLLDVPVNAGAQGILMGIALATVLTGVRVLLGQDRTYSA